MKVDPSQKENSTPSTPPTGSYIMSQPAELEETTGELKNLTLLIIRTTLLGISCFSIPPQGASGPSKPEG